MVDAVLFHLEDSVPDAGTTATVGRAVAGAAAAESRSPSEPATENRTWDLYGEYWEEGTFTRFGCEWGLFFETIPSCASAMVVVSRSAGLLNRFRANTDVETEPAVRVTDFFFSLASCYKVPFTVGELCVAVAMVNIKVQPRRWWGLWLV